MVLYPAIDLRHGHVVQLEGGDPHRVALERPSPEAQARAFEEAGSRWLHVVDLDAALGERNQWGHLGKLLSDRRSRVQFGGGIRHMTDVQQLLDLGVERVIVGTQAVRNPLWLRELARIFPKRIVLALDARAGHLVVDGWTTDTGIEAVTFAAGLDDAGLAAVIFTPVGGKADDGILAGLRSALKVTPLVVAAPDASLADLDMMAAAGIDGAVLGLSVYEGRLDLEEALARYPSPPRWPVLLAAAADEGLPEPGFGADPDE